MSGSFVNDTWAIDHVDSLGQGDVLPDLCFSRHWGALAHDLGLERVNHTRLSYVRVTDHTDGNTLLVLVEEIELSQKLNEGELSERFVDFGSESDGWGNLGQINDPLSSGGGWDEIDLVEQEDEVLGWAVLLDVSFDMSAPGSVWISSIEDEDDHI